MHTEYLHEERINAIIRKAGNDHCNNTEMDINDLY
jgi:hypothetical protein